MLQLCVINPTDNCALNGRMPYAKVVLFNVTTMYSTVKVPHPVTLFHSHYPCLYGLAGRPPKLSKKAFGNS